MTTWAAPPLRAETEAPLWECATCETPHWDYETTCAVCGAEREMTS